MTIGTDIKKRVLIVDPSRTMRRVIRTEFDPKRFDVIEAASGAEALTITKESAPNLVTLGTVLADGNGVELCEILASILIARESRIIVITSQNAEEERLNAFQHGIVHFIQKGFRPGELASYVDEILTPNQALNGRRILVVDDSPLPRECLRRLLCAHGATIEDVDDGSTALKLVESQPFDLVITDHFMSDVSGLEFIRIARRTLSPDELPIILVSATTHHAVLSDAMASGANDFMRKPFEAVELLARVNNCLRMSARAHRLREATREAESAQRAKSELFATMSHEILSPMTTVLGFAEHLKDGALNPEEQRSAIECICQGGAQLLSRVKEILDFSNIESGDTTIRNLDFSPLELLFEVETSLQSTAAEKGIRIVIDVASPIPERIQCDSSRLRQILNNLLEYAIRFASDDEARIKMRFVPAEDHVVQPLAKLEFEVANTGIELEPDRIQRIIDAFSQGDDITTSRLSGADLGLAISRRCAKLLGGNVVISNVPGFRSTLTASIPIGSTNGHTMIVPDVEAERVRHKANANAVARNKRPVCLQGRVLLADDAVFNQKLLQRILEKAGLSVTVVDNGRAAVELALAAQAEGDPFRVVLMDMQMPVLDGVSATRELRTLGFAAPVIALTANASPDDRTSCLEAGCDDFLTKPIDKQALLEAISHHFSRSEPVCVGSLAD